MIYISIYLNNGYLVPIFAPILVDLTTRFPNGRTHPHCCISQQARSLVVGAWQGPFTLLAYSVPLKTQQSVWVWGDVLLATPGWLSIVLDASIDKWLLLKTKNKRTGMHRAHGGNSVLSNESSGEF